MPKNKEKYSAILKFYRVSIILRILILALTIFFLVYSILKDYTSASVIFIAAVFCELYLLFNYLDVTHRRLKSFILSIKYSDFTMTIPSSGMGGSFRALENALNEVMTEFKNVRNEKEEHSKFLQTVIQHVGLGLLSYKQDGKVELINNAAKKLLGINGLVNINSLEKTNKPVFDKLVNISAGQKELVKFVDNNELTQLILYAAEFKRQNNMYKLVSIQNIQQELDEKEMEAWQGLISVLTHEIMNSITPVSSLSQTLENLLDNGPDDGNLEDIKSGISAIKRRSSGLIEFVNNYRSLTRIPVPDFSIIRVESLFQQVQRLLENKFAENNISFSYSIDPKSLELTADAKMIEQVLINLLLNSIEALRDTPTPVISLRAVMGNKGQIIIHIKDNGQGIQESTMERIFIPFFTTKPNGSGIGLSLARQIMRQHKGNITVFSKPDVETVFTLTFNW